MHTHVNAERLEKKEREGKSTGIAKAKKIKMTEDYSFLRINKGKKVKMKTVKEIISCVTATTKKTRVKMQKLPSTQYA